jgi:F-type H+-transporting ATPase subunit a
LTGETASRSGRISNPVAIGLLLVFVIVVDVLAFLIVPPFDKEKPDSLTCEFPVCYINGNLEFPAPHAVWRLNPDTDISSQLVVFDVSLSSTLVTMFGVTIIVILLLWLLSRKREISPGRGQNAIEYVYEMLENFGTSLGGPAAKPYIPLFAGFFLFILFCNWSGLIPPIGKIEELRAPTSDLNVTIGLALVAFVYIEYQGFSHLGIGYLGKFFPFGEFRNGIGAGAIAMFVGLTELLLEFVKPITLSMRLFGNIYGGEVALGVLTALTLALIPMAMLALEVLLNLVQALIFATLTLMFTLIALEGHGEEHEAAGSAEATIHAVEATAH